MSETNPRWWWLFCPLRCLFLPAITPLTKHCCLGVVTKKPAMLNDPDAVVAGRYSVDIWLNGRYVGRDDVLFRQNTAGRTEPCLPAKFWDEQGVTAASEQAQDCFAPEARISGGRWDFDQSLLRLNLSVPQAALKRTPWIMYRRRSGKAARACCSVTTICTPITIKITVSKVITVGWD